MKITYIDHSGFMIETAEKTFIFDYYRGQLPKIDETKPLFVFSSHHHEDHYNPEIFTLTASHKNAHYILDRKIKKHPDTENITHVRPNEEYEIDGVKIKTLLSTDTGVAYLIKADSETIYHAGDLHLWVWDGAPKFERNYIESVFRRELSYIADEKIDAAFLPIDPRQETDGVLGIDYAMKNLKIKKAFPMHFWGMPEYVVSFLESDLAKEYKDRIIPLLISGDTAEV